MMDNRSLFPESINRIIDSYVDVRQAWAELPASPMWDHREWIACNYETELRGLRKALVANICSVIKRRYSGRYVLYSQGQIEYILSRIHKIRQLLRFLYPKNIYHLSKVYTFDSRNIPLMESEEMLECRKRFENTRWREIFMEYCNQTPNQAHRFGEILQNHFQCPFTQKVQ